MYSRLPIAARSGFVLLAALLCSSLCLAQFTGSVQGSVQDPSAAGVPKASVRLQNTDTQVTVVTTTDAEGNFNFQSLAPGRYKVTVEVAGFTKAEANFTLLTEQRLNLPITMKVGSVSESVIVSTEAPVVDTADSRTQMTLENQAVAATANHRPQPGHAGDPGPRSVRLGDERRWEPCIGRGQLLHRRTG